jgi:hypothetical protein
VGISGIGFVRTKTFKLAATAVCVAALAGGITAAGLHTSRAEAAKGVTSPWSFGIIADTQWTKTDDGYNPNTVAANIIKQVDKQFINAGVKLVVAVGDTSDTGQTSSVDTRALYAQDLYNAGVAFYPLRGNHEATDPGPDLTYRDSAAEFKYAFPQIGTGVNNRTPAGITTAIIPAPDLANNAPAAKTGHAFAAGYGFSFPTAVNAANKSLSYSFRYKNATFVLIDQFVNQYNFPEDSDQSTIAQQQPWIDKVLRSRPEGTQAFVFSHKNILGGNHKDNLFGPNVSSTDPGDGNGVDTSTLTADQLAVLNAKKTAENNLLASLQANDVPLIISGHDHHDYVSLVTSPNGAAKVHQLITQSDSSKFYTPGVPVSANDVPLQQDVGRVGYYIVTVDGPLVTIDYYGATAGSGYYAPNGGTFTFQKMGCVKYSLNGKDFIVNQGGSYAAVRDNTRAAQAEERGYRGTSMAILAGTNGSTQQTNYFKAIQNDVNTGWKPATRGLTSDILRLSGMSLTMGGSQTDQYVLSMSYAPGAVKSAQVKSGKFGVVAKNMNGMWVPAVNLNAGGTKTFVRGPWKSSYGLGTYGVDPKTHKAWAVVNFNGEFAVGPAAK